MDKKELIEIARTYGEFIANNSKQVNDDNKLQYYLCGSLATMIYANATEISYCKVEDNKVVKIDDSIKVPQATKDSLELFARPMGDLDVMNLEGNMLDNSRDLDSDNPRKRKLSLEHTKKQIPSINKLFKKGEYFRFNDDANFGLDNSVNNHRVCKVKTANGTEIYVASPETIIAHKLEEIVELLGNGVINKTRYFDKEKYAKDIKDLMTSIEGFSKLYENNELSNRITEALLEKTSDSHFREHKEHLPKIYEAICRNGKQVISLNNWENEISIDNISKIIKTSLEIELPDITKAIEKVNGVTPAQAEKIEQKKKSQEEKDKSASVSKSFYKSLATKHGVGAKDVRRDSEELSERREMLKLSFKVKRSEEEQQRYAELQQKYSGGVHTKSKSQGQIK